MRINVVEEFYCKSYPDLLKPDHLIVLKISIHQHEKYNHILSIPDFPCCVQP
jgi:hypothetical protein